MADSWTCYERLEQPTIWRRRTGFRWRLSSSTCCRICRGLASRRCWRIRRGSAQACIDHQDIIGDGLHPILTMLNHQYIVPDSGWDQVTLNWRIFDDFPPQGNLPSAYFDKVMIEDYDDVMERGFASLVFNKQICRKVFDRDMNEFLRNAFEYPVAFAKAFRRFTEETGKSLLFGSRSIIPFDSIICYRTFPLVANDVVERPEKILQLCDRIADYEIIRAMAKCMDFGAGVVPGAERIFLANGMGAPPYISPRDFDEFDYPALKRQVDAAVQRGFKVHVHLDGNLTACLETLKRITDGLPKGMVMVDFEKTDMKKAKQVLGDSVCIYGNVPSALLVYGSQTRSMSIVTA